MGFRVSPRRSSPVDRWAATYVTSLLGVSYPGGIRNALYIDGVEKASQTLLGSRVFRRGMSKH